MDTLRSVGEEEIKVRLPIQVFRPEGLPTDVT